MQSGSKRRMAIIDRMPTHMQNSPGTSGVSTFMAFPVCSAYIPEIIMFGGVPMSVQMPPMPEA